MIGVGGTLLDLLVASLVVTMVGWVVGWLVGRRWPVGWPTLPERASLLVRWLVGCLAIWLREGGVIVCV